MPEATQAESNKPKFSIEQIRARRKRDCALGYRLFAAQRWGDLGDGHISARNPKPISAVAARFAKEDLIKFGVGRSAFASMLKLHIPDPEIVNQDT